MKSTLSAIAVIACCLVSGNASAQTKAEQCAAYARDAARSTPTTTAAARGAARGAVRGGGSQDLIGDDLPRRLKARGLHQFQ
jgi:hypothetical protein